MYGLFKEIGGCQMNKLDNDTIYNEHSWANFANVLFIEWVENITSALDTACLQLEEADGCSVIMTANPLA